MPAVNDLDEEAFAALCAVAPSVRVAWVDGRLAGFMVRFLPDAPYDSDNYRWFSVFAPFFYVDRIVVDPAYRDKGAASRACRRQVQARGRFSTIACELISAVCNALSLLAHRRMGFVPVGTDHKADGSKSVAYLCKAVTAP